MGIVLDTSETLSCSFGHLWCLDGKIDGEKNGRKTSDVHV